jgi:lysophospholipase L1-like esterase
VLLTGPCNAKPRAVSGAQWPENEPGRLDHLNRLYRQAAERHRREVRMIDLAARACPGGKIDPRLRQDDGVHFSIAGAEAIRAWLYPQLAVLAAAPAVSAGVR